MHKFDSVVLGALDIAQAEVMKRRHTELTPAHLLLGLIHSPQSKSSTLLAEEKDKVEKILAKAAVSSSETSFDSIKTSSELSKWIVEASARSIEEGRGEISEEDLLQTMGRVLSQIKVNLSQLNNSKDKQKIPDFLTDLCALAADGKLDPVIGRSKEIRAVIEILGRRSKNNPILVGPAGVGKTAIVEGLAGEIVKGTVPEVLRGKRVFALDMGSLMAGTKFRGEFEERIQKLLKFVKDSAGEIVLFIDEIHQLVGAGRTDGAMDAANLLKPALARGDLHCIGATTQDEFRKYILSDPALERRFRPVPVDEPSREDAVEIMMGIRDKHEMHHGIKISDEAIYASVMLSSQYITDKFLPDKAIDLVDEAASALKLSAESMPAELTELESTIRSKKILSKFEDSNVELLSEIDELQKRFDTGKAEWDKEVASLRRLSGVKNTFERARFDLETAERQGDFEQASRIKYSVLPELQKQLEGLQHAWVLNERHIAEVISRQTRIPVQKILKDKQEKLLELPAFLKARVFGQDECLDEVAETLLTSYAGLSDQSRPMGSFLFLGPTGVGKTETAKALTEFLFDSEDNMVRLDMSEFSEKHSVAKLIGSPAGYVGYDDGGVLTEAVRRKPYAVLLFDEIEKAHADFADILLQLLDDGRLTDNKGRTVNFRNTIVILTSNSKNIEKDFKPEVLGRLDAMLQFKALGSTVMEKLVHKQVAELNERLKQKKIHVELDEALISRLCERGYDSQYGARPLARVFASEVSRPLAHKLVKGEMAAGDYKLTAVESGIAVTKK